MEKSFYFVIQIIDAGIMFKELNQLGIPHKAEKTKDITRVRFVFPDLPVKQYARVRELFGQDGKRYVPTGAND